MGDIALENAAKLIKNCVRSSDLVARFGGDEFCIIMEKSSESDLEALVCRINNCLEEYNRSGFIPMNLSSVWAMQCMITGRTTARRIS